MLWMNPFFISFYRWVVVHVNHLLLLMLLMLLLLNRLYTNSLLLLSKIKFKVGGKNLNWTLKGTESVISSDPPCQDGYARFTTVLLKALSAQVWIRNLCFSFFKILIFICDFFTYVTCAFLAYKKSWRN